jgi:hypothetical protein
MDHRIGAARGLDPGHAPREGKDLEFLHPMGVEDALALEAERREDGA